MEADDVIIEYLRKKLGASRSARAEKVLKPPMASKADDQENPEIDPADAAELEALLAGETPEQESAEGDGEMCAECGKPSGTCNC